MSITGALSSALSGLTASARAAAIVSSNVANALTEGYGRREITLQARTVGGQGQGVSVIGVQRQVDAVLIGDRRLAEAAQAGQSLQAEFLQMLETAIGTPETEGSLGARIADLDSALIAAASRPELDTRLSTVADAATALTDVLADVTDRIQTARSTADRRIATEVDALNTALDQVAELNRAIRTSTGAGRDASALLDQRQQAVDAIATIIPVREVPREHGQIALFTAGGAPLLEGLPAVLGFQPAGMVVPEMTVAAGGLSGLTLNGRPVPMGADGGTMAGGSLAALFSLRDDLAPTAQARVDAVARDLVGRFADPAVDPTLAPGDAGLFTDAGAPFDAAHEVGLAGRLRLNAAVDPAQGGALWRLRDGLGATTQGPPGASARLTALGAALDAARMPASGDFTSGARSFATLASEMLSTVASQRVSADARVSYQSARFTALHELELQDGVDTDQELQSLLLIEQSYAANAKVIQSVDQMIQTLIAM